MLHRIAATARSIPLDHSSHALDHSRNAPDHSRNALGNSNIAIEIDLIEAQDQYSIIDIKPAHTGRIFQSTILAVDAQTRTILIEEPFPNDIGDIVGQPIEMTLRLADNKHTCLQSIVIAKEPSAQSIRYRVTMPPNCTYSQRRGAYRFKLAASSARSCEFMFANTLFCKGDLLDISLTGARALLVHHAGIAIGDCIEHLKFEFANAWFDSRAIVRNVALTHEGLEIIGVEWIDMPRLQLRRLEKTLAGMHRQRARQQAEDRTMQQARIH